MATLTIRNVPDHVRDRLRVRAAEHGRSMEAEARNLLEQAVSEAAHPAEDMAETVRRIQAEVRKFVPPGVSLVDELIADRRREAEQEDVEYEAWLAASGQPKPQP